ncbi:MAG: hypothetical protein K6B64_03465 [Acholeplasmatales bacterium]|nr:hypothetical protein [Acholeplasmatales bacterium]
MSAKNYSNLYLAIYSYLGYRNLTKDPRIDKLIEESLKEIEEISSFQYIYQEFDYLLDFLNQKPYLDYLNGSTNYLICAMTLGVSVDKRSKYYEKVDLERMFVFDATASAYLEYLSDEFERNLRPDLGYRFCPGYQGTDVSDIRLLYNLLKANKIGITLLDSNLMVPQKSMIGIVGINTTQKRSCRDCFLIEHCEYRKEGLRCYTKR